MAQGWRLEREGWDAIGWDLIARDGIAWAFVALAGIDFYCMGFCCLGLLCIAWDFAGWLLLWRGITDLNENTTLRCRNPYNFRLSGLKKYPYAKRNYWVRLE